MNKLLLSGLVACCVMTAQTTQIDLRAQAKPATAPVKNGTVLPAQCLSGDLFVKMDAPSGANLFACVAPNTWAVQMTSSSVTAMANGVTVGSRQVQNFISGLGLIRILSDAGSRIDIQDAIDTAIVQTRSNAQSGADVVCASTGQSSSAYTCSLPVALSAYTTGMVLRWRPDVGVNAGGATLSVSGLAPAPLRLPDGVSNLRPGDIAPGRMTEIWYDGSAFRLLVDPPGGEGARPTCDASFRGRLWYSRSNPGTKDELAVCAKDSSDQFTWKVIY